MEKLKKICIRIFVKHYLEAKKTWSKYTKVETLLAISDFTFNTLLKDIETESHICHISILALLVSY